MLWRPASPCHLHSGRVVRINTPDDTAWMHGVVAADRSAAALAQIGLAIPAQRVLTAVLVFLEAL
jgi:leucyl aminopeptidase (aminopeptidase T)